MQSPHFPWTACLTHLEDVHVVCSTPSELMQVASHRPICEMATHVTIKGLSSEHGKYRASSASVTNLGFTVTSDGFFSVDMAKTTEKREIQPLLHLVPHEQAVSTSWPRPRVTSYWPLLWPMYASYWLSPWPSLT